MTRRTTAIALFAAAAIAAGCGDEEQTATKVAPKPVDPEVREAQLDRDPYDLRCADIRDKVRSADISRRVQVALANDAEIPGLTQLQASQSIFFAITELCKGKPGSYRPAEDAIAGVRSGEYRADLGTP